MCCAMGRRVSLSRVCVFRLIGENGLSWWLFGEHILNRHAVNIQRVPDAADKDAITIPFR